MLKTRVTHFARWLLVSLLVAASGTALAQSEQQKLVNSANTTLSNFLRDPQMTWLQQNLRNAKAIVIAPQLVKAGFIFGGSGGRAVIFARGPGGKWVGPAFAAMATASVGFQAGVSVSEDITLVMTDNGFNTLLAPSMKIGGDASIAAGPVGAGASANIMADFVTFSRSRGVFGGLNLDGTVINTSNDWNQAFYGKPVTQPDILVRANVHNKSTNAIIAALTKATK